MITSSDLKVIQDAYSILRRELIFLSKAQKDLIIKHELEVCQALIENLCLYYKQPLHFIHSTIRTQPLVYHRQQMMYIIFKVTGYSKRRIAEAFEGGSRDHSRIYQAIKIVETLQPPELLEGMKRAQEFVKQLRIQL